MTTTNGLARAFKSEKAPVSETPALITPETWEDPGLLLIGPKRYGFRCYPGNRECGCSGIVRLFKDDGFAGDSYDVSFHGGQAQCTCPDYVYRRKDETGGTCRHIRAVVALGLDKQGAADAPPAPEQTDDEYAQATDPDEALEPFLDQPIPYRMV